jgi:hypothetical protein
VATKVWLEIAAWLQIPFSFPHSLFPVFYWLLSAGNPKAAKGRLMICCATVWQIWRYRNAVLFDSNRGDVSELVEAVKVASWKWWLARSKNSHCLYYEWKAEPTLCLLC